MAGTVTFTPAVGDPATVTYIPGTLNVDNSPDIKGGGNEPQGAAGNKRDDSLKIVIGTAFTLVIAAALRSGVGDGAVAVSGDAVAAKALLDVEILGEGVQKAKISWKGTKEIVAP